MATLGHSYRTRIVCRILSQFVLYVWKKSRSLHTPSSLFPCRARTDSLRRLASPVGNRPVSKLPSMHSTTSCCSDDSDVGILPVYSPSKVRGVFEWSCTMSFATRDWGVVNSWWAMRVATQLNLGRKSRKASSRANFHENLCICLRTCQFVVTEEEVLEVSQ